MQRTIVHMMRHGEVHNPDGILYGRLPHFGLSTTGTRQAGRVADELADHDITAVFASPLQRDHVHFIDGAAGGYAMAAASLKAKAPI